MINENEFRKVNFNYMLMTQVNVDGDNEDDLEDYSIIDIPPGKSTLDPKDLED